MKYELNPNSIFNAVRIIVGCQTRHDRCDQDFQGPRRRLPGGRVAAVLLALLTTGWLLATAANVRAGQVMFDGWPNSSLGRATLSVVADGLRVANIGSSGEDGVVLDLGELARSATLQFGPGGFALSPTGQVTFSAGGTVGGELGRSLGNVTLSWQSNVLALAFQPVLPGIAGGLRAEIVQQGVLTGNVDVPPGGRIGLLSGETRLLSITAGQSVPSGSRWAAWDLEFAGPIRLTTSTGSFLGNHVRLITENPFGSLQNLAGMGILGRNLGSFVIRHEDAPRFQPRLSIDSAGPDVALRWNTRNATLQSAARITGPWSNVVQGLAATNIPTRRGNNQYFRLMQDSPLDLSRFAQRRNVLLIIADDVGVDQIPTYIDYYAGTPRLDDDILVDASIPTVVMPSVARLARAGVTFLNACSSPTCSPTRAGLFTGRRSFRHEVYSPARPNLPFTETTIAEVLNAEGYLSGLFGKWHLGNPSAVPAGQNPLSFGWNRHYGALNGDLSTSYYSWDKVEDNVSLTSTTYASLENVDDALAWISARSNSTWMATVAFNSPHWSSGPGGLQLEMPPAAYRARVDDGGRGTYRSMLENVDLQILRLLLGINRDVLDRTTIIFMGDNGTDEELGVNYHFSSAHSKATLYEGGVNVPLIIADGSAWTFRGEEEFPWFPWLTKSSSKIGHVTSPGRFNTNLVQTMDIFATAAAIAGGDASSGDDSVSLIPYLNSGVAAAQRTHTLAETRTPGWTTCGDAGWNISIRDTTYKLHVRNYGSATESYELYDLSTDRWELTDIWNAADATLVAIRDGLLGAIATELGTSACP